MVDGLVSVCCITEEIRLYYWKFTVQTLLSRSPSLKSTLSVFWSGSVRRELACGWIFFALRETNGDIVTIAKIT